MKRFAFDIGGTNMRMAEVSETGIGPVARLPTPKEPLDALERLVALARSASHEDGIERAVVALAAIVGTDGAVVTATHLPLWNGFALGASLSRELHAPVAVVNDAELAALGEARYGAGQGFANVAYITVGTGVGTAHVVEGAIEAHSSEGEARAAIIALPHCKSLETTIGGRALEVKYGMPAEELPRAVWKELAACLAHGAVEAARLWSADVVVLGGSLMNETNGFRIEDVERGVGKCMKPSEAPPLIRRMAFEDASALEGARALM